MGGVTSLDSKINKIESDINISSKNIQTWIDLTDKCNFRVNVDNNNTGAFANRIYYNTKIRHIIGTLYTDSAVENQSILLTLPSLDYVGVNKFTGICGIGYCKNGSPVFVPRIAGNTIYSSHTEAVTLPAEIFKYYLFSFVVL